ncbi:tRNA uridine-5-carboxymethylaminomethyl(34) synthesis GTPase MnmE [Altererythrobacter sp. MF3-039]|uniref:tRNA uridine-5-carboxymethylaminomethyl(34) synthesis GTPase MnmE n=1 Tax=Altererythrobacter sp. MF3-039 TaxID=3252901 RepID=UPI00390C93B0
MDTIFALSSGAPPAAIAVIRISGPDASSALGKLAGDLPEPRRISYRTLQTASGATLDHAIVIWLPGPNNATGEDCAELHCHGGRAVAQAVLRELGTIAGLREAEPGEFTRRAFLNGRIDLAEAEGLADLLEAETEIQRASAISMAGGMVSHQVELWREEVLRLSAQVEASLDFSDEDDVEGVPLTFGTGLEKLKEGVSGWLDHPHAERLKEGYKVVIAGPPNAGKSTLFNALTDSEAAITSPIAGTTRDVIERSVALSGIPFSFIDTAGLRSEDTDAIEAIGIDRAHRQIKGADCVLWLGPESKGPIGAWEIESQIDLDRHETKSEPKHRVSALSGEGLDALRSDLVEAAKLTMPKPGEVALNTRQRAGIAELAEFLDAAVKTEDLLILAEHLRRARVALDMLVGRTTTEDMLDALFGRFCIGK